MKVSIVDHINPDQPLPDNVTIRFQFGDRWDQFIEVSARQGYPETPHITVRGGGPLVIHPSVSNLIHISKGRP